MNRFPPETLEKLRTIHSLISESVSLEISQKAVGEELAAGILRSVSDQDDDGSGFADIESRYYSALDSKHHSQNLVRNATLITRSIPDPELCDPVFTEIRSLIELIHSQWDTRDTAPAWKTRSSVLRHLHQDGCYQSFDSIVDLVSRSLAVADEKEREGDFRWNIRLGLMRRLKGLVELLLHDETPEFRS